MNDENLNPSVDLEDVKIFCKKLLTARLDEKALAWLDKTLRQLEVNLQARDFYLSFNLAPRFVGKSNLSPTKEEKDVAESLKTSIKISNWTVDLVTRNLILLHLPFEQKETTLNILKNLYETAGLEDSVALYSGLSLMPIGKELANRGAEGIRTNMVAVFDAIALDNPYPKEYFTEIAWNQMVLKAFFMERPVYRIIGVEQRQNPRLAAMISDYAHERWAAGRNTMPEMWRFVVGFIDQTIAQDLEKMMQSDDELQQKAAALACHQSDAALAKTILNKYNKDDALISSDLSWVSIGKQWAARQIQKETLYE